MSRPAPNTRLPASATEPELMQPPMDNRCPACRADLQGRYLGAIDIRCPDCAAPLRYNLHPAENGPWHREVGIYPAGFASLVVVGVAEILLDWSTLSTLLATIASTTA